jgi:microcystin-dependent protein
MGQPYIGEIRMFGGNFAPAGWAFCDGRLIAISENDALFTLIGTTYGGDGQETFALPNLQGRIPVDQGQGSGLSNYDIGQNGGTEQVTLNTNNLPQHTHSLIASGDTGNTNSPDNAVLAGTLTQFYFPFAATAAMSAQSINPTGSNNPHDNMMPYLCISFIISLFGIFPHQ